MLGRCGGGDDPWAILDEKCFCGKALDDCITACTARENMDVDVQIKPMPLSVSLNLDTR